MNKKAVVFGGGTGMSYLLKGLKEYPLDITAVVSVCDDGGSTGKLRDELDILAVGDIRKILVALSRKEGEFENLLNYRFKAPGTLNNHTVGNILLAGATNVGGSAQKGIKILSKVLNLAGNVVPFTEDNITLIGEMEDGSIIKGEHNITESPKRIKRVYYDKEPVISDELIKTIVDADVIVLSMGSLFTSVIPTILSSRIIEAIDASNAKIVYSCNLFTQPGETDGFAVSDHVRAINEYLGERKVDVVIANGREISGELAKKYAIKEQKDPIALDRDNIASVCKEAIIDDLVIIENNVFRHDCLKLGYLIFSVVLNHDYRDDIKPQRKSLTQMEG